ncbi:MAG: TIGR02452 family protein [Myxococcota bacterium]
MSLKGTAKSTLEILSAGAYVAPSGTRRSIQPALRLAIEDTRLYRPGEVGPFYEIPAASSAQIEVVEGTTQAWAQILVEEQGVRDLVLLDFASARNPGGGFLNGAKAQEEDLARCSGLYPCLLDQPEYYDANRDEPSMLYTDHLIYAPRVPFFRSRNRDLLEHPFLASVIVAPAPNATQHLRREPQGHDDITRTLRRRASLVLGVAKDAGHRTLLLGAWGCGVFGNEPSVVARAFGSWLDTEPFAKAFDRVMFAIYDGTRDQRTLGAFQAQFGV